MTGSPLLPEYWAVMPLGRPDTDTVTEPGALAIEMGTMGIRFPSCCRSMLETDKVNVIAGGIGIEWLPPPFPQPVGASNIPVEARATRDRESIWAAAIDEPRERNEAIIIPKPGAECDWQPNRFEARWKRSKTAWRLLFVSDCSFSGAVFESGRIQWNREADLGV